MKKIIIVQLLIFLISYNLKAQTVASNAVIPTENQIRYQQMELIGFIHFSMNTFTGKEWGYGDDDPKLFNPTQLDAEQWVAAAKAGGLKELILTAKHHDGFCLWPSKYTEYSIKNSSYKNGKGDIVKEFTDACHKNGINVGLYLSPWDRNHKDYGKPEYIAYYRNQLKELLTNYGEINEIWFDGANGGDGYYGGAKEKRIIDKRTYYQWKETIKLVKNLQPNILVFSDAGPDIRWIGNENGAAGETFWSTISDQNIIPGEADQTYLNTGEPGGNRWMIGQCDVSVRPGWFYHAEEDSLVKTPQQLMDIYEKSVGRNAVLLLNIPPDRRGLICEKDIAALKAFHKMVQKTYKTNLAFHKLVNASSYRLNDQKFSPKNITDDNPETFWTTDDGITNVELEIDLGGTITFDRIMLQEAIALGQRIGAFDVSVFQDGAWKLLISGTTIGYKRLLKIPVTMASKIKIQVKKANNPPTLSEFGLFLSPK